MSEESRWQERYQNNETPWDTGRPDSQLIRMMLEFPIRPCNLLEIGCGTGTNAIWLAQHEFKVTGVDISEAAILKAKEKALNAEVKCEFFAADFLNEKIIGAPFDFLFDRGCFHSFHGNPDEQKRFAENAANILHPSGLWLNFSGSADDPPRDTGPPGFQQQIFCLLLSRILKFCCSKRAILIQTARIRPVHGFV